MRQRCRPRSDGRLCHGLFAFGAAATRLLDATQSYFGRTLNAFAGAKTNNRPLRIEPRQRSMKIALLALLGAILGALGGGAIGIVAGIGWIEVFKSKNSEAMLVFFIFMPIGAMAGAVGGAILFAVLAARDGEI